MKLRLAPHAAGLLHVGSARIALLTWFLARGHQGALTLRLDDLDPRVTPEGIDALQHDLAWLGLEWDGVVRQSERAARYEAAAERLKQAGRLYPCFESEEELTAKREHRRKRGQATIYDRAMLKLTAQQRAKAEAGGKRPYWRFQLSGVPAEWGDMVLGKQSVKLSAIEDPVLLRDDGTPTPAFAAAVDDLDLGITHIVRGADHVSGTGVQLDIRAALGGAMQPGAIRFAHVPMPPGKARPPTLRSLRADGVDPAALAGLLAAMGSSGTPLAEMPGDLLPGFDLSRIGRKPPAFDLSLLLDLNATALGTLDFEEVEDRLPQGATPAFWDAICGHIELLREARGWWDVVAGGFVPAAMPHATAKLQAAVKRLQDEPQDWAAWIGRDLKLLRLALTGEEMGPPLEDLLPLIGRARIVERLRLAAGL